MKSDINGKIAYHSLRFNEDGGTDFVQYDFEGKEESVTPYRPAPPRLDLQEP